MAINSLKDLLDALVEVEPANDSMQGATEFIQQYEQRRLDLFSRSTDNEDLLSAANAKVKELESSLDGLGKEKEGLEKSLIEQKARNYDLLMQVQRGDAIEGAEDPISNAVDPNGAVYHIDSLFTEQQLNSPFNQTGMEGTTNNV